MAITSTNLLTSQRPRWPKQDFDPARAYVDYDEIADELVIYFGSEPIAAMSDLIDAPEGDDAALLLRLDADGRSTDEVVGIHVYPLVAGAARQPAHWRRLAAPNPPAELVENFVADVRDLFERYWTPAPPIEEQFAALRRTHPEE